MQQNETPLQLQERTRLALATRDRAYLWSLLESHLQAGRPAEEEISAHTLSTYRAGLNQLLSYAEAEGVSLTDLPPLQQFADWMKVRGAAPMSMRTRVTAAQHLVRALEAAGFPNPRALGRVRFPPHRGLQQDRRPYTEAEVDALLSVADAEERVILLLGLEAGLKAGEMVRLRWEEVHLEDPFPSLSLRGRGGFRANWDLTLALQGALLNWSSSRRGADSRVLSGQVDYVDDRMRQLCARAEVMYTGAGVEGLRLTAGARRYRHTGSTEDVRAFLRLGTLRDARRYVAAAELI